MDFTGKRVVLSNANAASPGEKDLIAKYGLDGAVGKCTSDMETYVRVIFKGYIILDLAKNLFTLAE